MPLAEAVEQGLVSSERISTARLLWSIALSEEAEFHEGGSGTAALRCLPVEFGQTQSRKLAVVGRDTDRTRSQGIVLEIGRPIIVHQRLQILVGTRDRRRASAMEAAVASAMVRWRISSLPHLGRSLAAHGQAQRTFRQTRCGRIALGNPAA